MTIRAFPAEKRRRMTREELSVTRFRPGPRILLDRTSGRVFRPVTINHRPVEDMRPSSDKRLRGGHAP